MQVLFDEHCRIWIPLSLYLSSCSGAIKRNEKNVFYFHYEKSLKLLCLSYIPLVAAWAGNALSGPWWMKEWSKFSFCLWTVLWPVPCCMYLSPEIEKIWKDLFNCVSNYVYKKQFPYLTKTGVPFLLLAYPSVIFHVSKQKSETFSIWRINNQNLLKIPLTLSVSHSWPLRDRISVSVTIVPYTLATGTLRSSFNFQSCSITFSERQTITFSLIMHYDYIANMIF